MNNITENIRWLHLGNLSNFKTSDVSGCYVFVYDNKRIIYVGTTSNIGKRLLYHLEAIKSGRRPIWRVKDAEDVYSLMKNPGKNRMNKLKELALNNSIWINYESNEKCENILNPKDDFESNWKEYIENDFLPKIDIWITDINGKKEYSTLLESRLQILIRTAFKLGSLRGKINQSWLGRIENPNISNEVIFKFKNYPKVDSETIAILGSINKSHLTITSETKVGLRKRKVEIYNNNYFHNFIRVNSKKEVTKVAKQSVEDTLNDLKANREQFKFYKTHWTKLEDNILKLMVEKKLEITEISKELNRSPQEIEVRIVKLKID